MTTPTSQYESWLNALDADAIAGALTAQGCTEVLVRRLSAKQGNSKQQIYLGTDLAEVARIPSGALTRHTTRSTKLGAEGREIFHAPVELVWLAPDFEEAPAPNTKVIFYPQYPEVRLSGFLEGSPDAPTWLLSVQQRGRDEGRLLLLAPTPDGRLLALCLPPEARAIRRIEVLARAKQGPLNLWVLDAPGVDPRQELLQRLAALHSKGWVTPSRLTASGLHPCRGTNCGGYTLEANLGVFANSRAEPDLLGWELKAHSVRDLGAVRLAGVLTLMTPQPDGGPYVSMSLLEFLQKYGYSRRSERWDFTGVHRVGSPTPPHTGTRLVLQGYRSPRSYDPAGCVALLDRNGDVAASWSFAKLLDHWSTKHALAAYVPYERSPHPGIPGFLTQGARDRLQAELDELSGPGRTAIARKIQSAREEGDLRENRAYHAAKEEQGRMEARIRQLTELLESRPGEVRYRYGSSIWLGTGTSFPLLLQSIAEGSVYFDPGMRAEFSNRRWDQKPRSQFRVRATGLAHLYDRFEVVNCTASPT